MNYDNVIEQAKKNSIGSDKKQKLIIKVKKVASAAIIIIVAFVTAICTTGCAKRYDKQMAQMYNLEYQEEAERIMHDHGLNTEERHDYEIFAAMEEISEEIFSGFYQLLGPIESEKAVRALGYEGWDDYLIKHGYTEYGKPSFEKWEESWVTARESTSNSKGEMSNGNESSRTR